LGKVSALLSISPEGDSLCLSSVSLFVLIGLILFSGRVSSVSLSNTVSSFLIFLRLEGLVTGNKDSEELDFSDTLKERTDTGFLETASASALIISALYTTSYSYSASLNHQQTRRHVGSFTECSHFNG
jgi:hypothetical protein